MNVSEICEDSLQERKGLVYTYDGILFNFFFFKPSFFYTVCPLVHMQTDFTKTGAFEKLLPEWRFFLENSALLFASIQETGALAKLCPGKRTSAFRLHWGRLYFNILLASHSSLIFRSNSNSLPPVLCRWYCCWAFPGNVPFWLFFKLLIGHHVLTLRKLTLRKTHVLADKASD